MSVELASVICCGLLALAAAILKFVPQRQKNGSHYVTRGDFNTMSFRVQTLEQRVGHMELKVSAGFEHLDQKVERLISEFRKEHREDMQEIKANISRALGQHIKELQ